MALQAAYALGDDMIGDLGESVEKILAAGREGDEPAEEHSDEVLEALVQAFNERREEAIELLEGGMTMPLDNVALVERLALVLGALEILSNSEVSKAVFINEWIEVTKEFGSAGGHKLVNAILDGASLGKAPGA